MSILINSLQHMSAPVKNVTDAFSVSSVLYTVMTAFNPIIEFVILFATALWFILRVVDLLWTLVDRWKNRKIKKGL